MDTVVRVVVAYVFIIVGLRLVGKRTFGQLSPADFAVLMLIPELFQQALTGEDFSMTTALVAVATLLVTVVVIDTIAYRLPRFGRVLSSKGVTVVSHGFLRADRMDRERLSPDEILDAMHRAGLEKMEQVKFAVLYPDGIVAVIPWKPDPGRQEDATARPA